MYSFYALVARTKNIDRWALMRNAEKENVQEHSYMTAVIAHALASIRMEVYGKPCSPDRCATVALFHDVPEVFTGDMPTPVKYHDDEIVSVYKKLEDAAIDRLMGSIPEELQSVYREDYSPDDETAAIVKAADKMAAYIKCLSELRAGNEEFRPAALSTLGKLQNMNMPEVEYFIEKFIPAFQKTLDEISL